MKFLLIVNQSPWGSELSSAALRLARAIFANGDQLTGVFFQGEGVYNAIGGTCSDQGTPELNSAWRELAGQNAIELILCSAAVQRRFGDRVFDHPFRVAGLIEVFDMIDGNDRVVTF